MDRLPILIAGLALATAAGQPALAQQQSLGPDSAPAYTPPPPAVAVRAAQPPRLDGLLDDEAWQAATPFSEFTQLDPHQG
jgi:hypothetical protein